MARLAPASYSSPTSTKTSRKDGRGPGSEPGAAGRGPEPGGLGPGRAEASSGRARRVLGGRGALCGDPPGSALELRSLSRASDGGRGRILPSTGRLCLFGPHFSQSWGRTLWPDLSRPPLERWGWVLPYNPPPSCTSALLLQFFPSSAPSPHLFIILGSL